MLWVAGDRRLSEQPGRRVSQTQLSLFLSTSACTGGYLLTKWRNTSFGDIIQRRRPPHISPLILSVCLSIHLSIHPLKYLSVPLSIHPPTHWPFTFICLYLYLSVCLIFSQLGQSVTPHTHTHTFCVRLTHREVLVVLKEKDAQFKMHRCVTRIEIRKVYKMCIMLASADLGGGVGNFFLLDPHMYVLVYVQIF